MVVVEEVVAPVTKNSMFVSVLNGESSLAISIPLLQSRASSCGEVEMLLEAIRFPPPILSRSLMPLHELAPVPVSLIVVGLKPVCQVPVGFMVIPGPDSL